MPYQTEKTDKKRITLGMSFDAHTHCFGTQFFCNSDVHFYSCFAELDTSKQTAFQWYRMQRARREYTPRLSYVDVVKKHSNYISKGLLQSISKTRSVGIVKRAFDPQTSYSSALANKQSCGNKTTVCLENEQKYSHKAQHNTCHIPTSHILTSNHFQILQDLNADTIGNSVLIPSMHQSVQNSPIEPTKVDATGRASKSRLPKVSQLMTSNEPHQVVNQLTTALMPTLGMQENSVQLGNKNKTGLIPRGIHISSVSYDKSVQSQGGTPPQIDNGIANQTNKNSCFTTPDHNSIHNLDQYIPGHVFADRHKCIEHNNCVRQNGNDFGFILLTALNNYSGNPVHYDQIPDIITAHNIITKTGLPNFLGARIPIASQLHPQRWCCYLANFWDKQLPDLIENLLSALQNTTHVEQYIMEEHSYGAIHGPYHEKPFPMHVSPNGEG